MHRRVWIGVCAAAIFACVMVAAPSGARAAPGFDAARHIELAAQLQSMSTAQRLRALRRFAKQPGVNGFALVRMLFEAKPGSQCRPPRLGKPVFVGNTSAAHWPRQPIAIVDGVPFVVVTGYILGGLPERFDDYLRYNLRSCQLTGRTYRRKSRARLRRALRKLLQRAALRGKLAPHARRFLTAQAP